MSVGLFACLFVCLLVCLFVCLVRASIKIGSLGLLLVFK